MSRKVGIIVSVILALIFTFLITFTANQKYQKATETVEIAKVAEYIPAGTEIKKGQLKTVEVPKSLAKDFITVKDSVGKVAKVTMVEGQYITKEALDSGKAIRKGFVEVFVPVDLASSAMAIPGQYVNVHVVNKEGTAPQIIGNVRVLHSMDSKGTETNAKGGKMDVADTDKPSAIGLEIPSQIAEKVVLAAANDNIYLTRVINPQGVE